MAEEMRQELGYALAMVGLIVGTLLALVGAWQLGAALPRGDTDALVPGVAFLVAGAVLAGLGLLRRSRRETDDDALP